MSNIKAVHTNKKNDTLLLRFVLSIFFFFISYSIAPYCIAEDKSSIKGGLFPVHTQSSQVITEEMLDIIVEACDQSLSKKIENQLFSYKTGGYYVEKGIFVPTRIKDPNVLTAFNKVLKPGVHFLDLGSGDGRVVFLASLFGAASTGIEFDEDIFNSSLKAREKLSKRFDLSKTELIRGDFFDADFSGYDVIYYFMSGSFEEKRLEDKLAKELKPGAILVGYIEHEAFKELNSAGRIGKRITVYKKQ
ncbi:MAG: class I SAM-dependent methyltransferase [Thermodesulfobacteriota bacterium]